MYPDDRVLVAYVPRPTDFTQIQTENWYRIPVKSAPKGLYAEYVAFYFGRKFGDKKWAIHYFAENLGHELARRIDLLPNEPNHPRAQEVYYQVKLGPLKPLERPIISLQWRRVLFIHTTWDRFKVATEIQDLTVDGEGFVDRQFVALRENQPPAYKIAESSDAYDW